MKKEKTLTKEEENWHQGKKIIDVVATALARCDGTKKKLKTTERRKTKGRREESSSLLSKESVDGAGRKRDNVDERANTS